METPVPSPAAAMVRSRRGKLTLVALLTVLLLVTVDVCRAPQRQVTARTLLSAIHVYQRWLSPRLPTRCRFRPTCSRYAAAVIEQRGAVPGTLLTAWRLLRCAPWTPAGTDDPPPNARPPGGDAHGAPRSPNYGSAARQSRRSAA